MRSSARKQLSSRYGDGFVMILGLSEDDDLSPEQSEQLRNDIVEARERYDSSVKELSEETREEILREFSREYRDDLRESVQGFIEKETRRLPTKQIPGGQRH